MNATDNYATTSTRNSAGHKASSSSICRPNHDRMIAGVASGVARSLGIDPLIVRIGFVVLALIGAAGVALYVAGWLLIPDERSGRSLAADLIQSISARRS
jgi:phage shock protein PspC (stress-responsive transcriptional regulator)